MNIERLTAWIVAETRHIFRIVKKPGLSVHAETRYGETYVTVSV